MLIKLKKSTTSGYIPAVNELEQGEMGMNVPDGLLYLKRVNGSEAVMKLYPFTGEFKGVSGDAGAYTLNSGVYVQGNFKLVLSQTQNNISLPTNLLNGFSGKLIVTQSNAAYRILVPSNVLIEDNTASYQSYGYSRVNINETTAGPPEWATFRATSAHNLSTNDYVFLDGYTGDKAAYNGLHQVREVSDTLSFSIDVNYEASGHTSGQPTVERYRNCLNIEGTTIFEIIADGSNIYLRKIGDYS